MSTKCGNENFISQNLPFLIFFSFFALLAWDVASTMTSPIIWAAMLSFVSMPIFHFINKKMLRGHAQTLSAMLTLLVLLILCVVPVAYIITTLGSEAAGMGVKLTHFLSALQAQAFSGKSIDPPAWMPLWASDYIRSFLENSAAVKNLLSGAAQWGAKALSSLSASVIEQGSSFLFSTMVTLMVSFFFIRDGGRIITWIMEIVPLSEDEKGTFFTRTASIMNSIIYGAILTVAAQAILGALGWWFVGLGSPALFGMLMFFFGMFPMGTAVVWGPGALYLALSGDAKQAVFLFIWGACVVSVADNVLRPFLISGGGAKEHEIPTLLIILGIFGGLIKWGFLGIFIGPLVLVLFVSVCDLYKKRWLDR
ncbi:MAG: AI-2E family transporter [Cloacibacillus sp.]